MTEDNCNFASRCPSCMSNLVQSICQLTCSPHQSTFMEMKKSKKDPQTNATYITEVNYYITQQYMDKTYNSCKQVNALKVLMDRTLMGSFRSQYQPPGSWRWIGCVAIGVLSAAPQIDGSLTWEPRETPVFMYLSRSITSIPLRQKWATLRRWI